jgi:uncharacterized protein (DUF58 family)
MLDALWLAVICAAGVWAVWSGHRLLALTTALALLASASILLWRRWSLAGVHYRRRLETRSAAFGDTVELTIEILNLKPLPLTWLQIEDVVPRRLVVEGASVRQARSEFFHLLTIVVAMLPYERIVRRLKVRCTRRGEHRFGPTSLESGDYLGALTSYGSLRDTDTLVVYPKIFPVELGRLPSNQMLGRDAARRLYMTDPIRVLGAREYVCGDPFRAVDWRATARLDKLMVRIYEPSATPVVDLVLNIATPARAGNYEPDELEFVISVAASLAAYAAEKRWAVGLRANGYSGRVPIMLPPSAAPGQQREILECLTRASPIASGPIAALLATPALRMPPGATLLLVTTVLDRGLVDAVRDLHRRGRAIFVVHLGTPGIATPELFCAVARIEYDENWTQREALVLGR